LASYLQNTEGTTNDYGVESRIGWRGLQMKEEIQIIERNRKPEWAVLPYEEYLKLIEQAELLEDIRDFDEMSAAIERGEEELIPGEVFNAILDGKIP
jgi:hypothetical protein